MSTYLDDFVTQVREAFNARNAGVADLSSPNIKRSINKVILEYTRFKPRFNLVGNAVITNGSRIITLPTDFIGADNSQLYFAVTGQISNTSWFVAGALSVFDSELGATLFPPPNYRQVNVAATTDGMFPLGGGANGPVSLTTADDGSYGLLMATPATETVTREITYNGLHQLTNDKFTIPFSDRDIIEDMVIGQSLLILANDALAKQGKSANIAPGKASAYKTLALQYLASKKKLANFGFIG